MGSAINLAEVGVKLTAEEARFHKETVADLLASKSVGSFPGAQPVSFCRHHFAALEQVDYFMCEKTDGIRCLLFCTVLVTPHAPPRELYILIDRKNDYYAVPEGYLHFPPPGDDIAAFHTGTILDGELVRDTLPDGSSRLKYLIFDCLALDGRRITDRTLDVRLGKVKGFFYEPYRRFARQWPDEIRVAKFEAELKNMEFPYANAMMFRDRIPRLPHGNDGLIFTCRATPYVTGTDPHILKWKPPLENTIDFRLDIDHFPTACDAEGEYEDWDAKPEIHLKVNYGNNDYRFFAVLSLTDAEWETIKSMNQQIDGRIIECYRTPSPPQWRPKLEKDGTPRFRDDKREANHISTVTSVLESIEDAVTEEELIAHDAKIKAAYKERQEKERQKRKAQQQQQQKQQQQPQQKRPTPASAPVALNADTEDDGPRYED